MGFASLGSGSKGNGTVVSLHGTGTALTVLIDCGFTLKQTERRLARLGLSGGDLDAILVTHEHADHIAGVAALAHKFAVPVYASYGTARKLDGACRCFDGDVPFELNGVRINPVRVPHDAREPTQFVLDDGVERVGVLSDLGSVTQHVREAYSGCTHLLMESNHDTTMLANGSYPPRLKVRVGARYGHLNNEQAVAFLDDVAHASLHVVIGHVSEQNNCMELLQQVYEPMRARVASIAIASQQDGFDWVGQRPITRQVSFADAL